jgi:hypothetical protein
MYNGIPMVMREKFSASSYWKDCVKYRVTAAQYIGEVCRYRYKYRGCNHFGVTSVGRVFHLDGCVCLPFDQQMGSFLGTFCTFYMIMHYLVVCFLYFFPSY